MSQVTEIPTENQKIIFNEFDKLTSQEDCESLAGQVWHTAPNKNIYLSLVSHFMKYGHVIWKFLEDSSEKVLMDKDYSNQWKLDFVTKGLTLLNSEGDRFEKMFCNMKDVKQQDVSTSLVQIDIEQTEEQCTPYYYFDALKVDYPEDKLLLGQLFYLHLRFSMFSSDFMNDHVPAHKKITKKLAWYKKEAKDLLEDIETMI